jgi:hypothetical protein
VASWRRARRASTAGAPSFSLFSKVPEKTHPEPGEQMHSKTSSFVGTALDTRAQMPHPSCTHAPNGLLGLGSPLFSRPFRHPVAHSEVVVARGATQLHRGRSSLFPCNCLPLFFAHHHHPFIRAGRIYHRQDSRDHRAWIASQLTGAKSASSVQHCQERLQQPDCDNFGSALSQKTAPTTQYPADRAATPFMTTRSLYNRAC